MRTLLTWTTLVIALLAIGCSSDLPTFEPDWDVGRHDISGDPYREPHYTDTTPSEAPVIAPVGPIEIMAGQTVHLQLRTVVSDPDTPFDDLAITLTDSAHVTGTVTGDVASLTAAAGFEGTEQMTLRAEDPDGLWAQQTFDVIVEEAQPAPARSCATRLTYNTSHGAADTVAFASEANDWNPTEDMMTGPDGQGNFTLEIELDEGAYGYKFVRNGDDWIEDPTNPYHVDVGCCRNSLLLVPDCHQPLLEVAEIQTDPATGRVTWILDVFDSPGAPGIDLASFEATVDWEPVPATSISARPDRITITLTGLEPAKYSLRASIADVQTTRSQVLYVPVWLEEDPFAWEDAVMYFAFVDRFQNGDSSNDQPLNTAVSSELVDWNGGDYIGLTEAIEDGYFDDLGVNTLWISSPNDNPDVALTGERITDDFTPTVSSYHGYFPRAARETENHFGTLEELRTLSRTAHQHGIRIVVDFVANHVYEDHPYYTGRSEGEFNTPMEVCREIDWVRPVTCWFEPYLPDLNYERRDILERTVADALWWIDAADLDGFRLDAVKHMPHNLSTILRARVDRMMEPSGLHFYLIGETFTGDWAPDRTGALEQLAEYISVGELSGQFNFPIYWEIVRTLARREWEAGYTGFQKIDAVIQASEARFLPPGIMGTFLGNHDVVRFVTHAHGEVDNLWGNGSKVLAYFNPPIQPGESEPEPYQRLRLAMALILTLPGIPVIYYGDEIGLAGAGDPDNRRMYPWDAGLTTAQTELFQTVEELGQLRRQREEIRRGERHTLSNGDVYTYARQIGSHLTVVAINNTSNAQNIDVAVSSWVSDGTVLTDGLGGGTATVTSGRLQASIPGLDVAVFTSP